MNLHQAICAIYVTVLATVCLTEAADEGKERLVGQLNLQHPLMAVTSDDYKSSINNVMFKGAPETNKVQVSSEFGYQKSVPTGRGKRSPAGFAIRGMHDDAFDQDFGKFSPMKKSIKRRPKGDLAYGSDVFGGFGDFETMKRDASELDSKRNIPYYAWLDQAIKRAARWNKAGFHDNAFNEDFGEFHPMRK